MTQREQDLALIRTKCAEVSNTMELKFGCRLKDAQYGLGFVVEEPNKDGLYPARFKDYAGGVNTMYSIHSAKNREEDLEILGREPMLHDVLLAIGTFQDSRFEVDAIGRISENDIPTDITFNLPAGGIEHQDDPTIRFIASLL